MGKRFLRILLNWAMTALSEVSVINERDVTVQESRTRCGTESRKVTFEQKTKVTFKIRGR